MLFSRLHPFFTENGFQAQPALGIFRSRQPGGWLTVAISESHYPEGNLTELHLGIRHELVEEIVYPFALGLQSPGGEAHTLMVSQGKIAGKGPQREWVRDESDAVLVARQWQQWMLEKGFAWLEIHRETAWLDQLYNDHPDIARQWQPNAFHRSLRAIALAYLTQRPDFRSIVQRGKRDLAAAAAAPELLLRLDGLVGALP
ncbi:MAG: hypothetical protein LH618_05505 [Saprospiraceae bacterium]|nr:hypothetical protein [Saprospiraceae bacterium]